MALLTAELPDEYFRDLALTAGLGIIATDEQYLVRFCNTAAAEMIGRPAAELIGQTIPQIMPPDRVALHSANR